MKRRKAKTLKAFIIVLSVLLIVAGAMFGAYKYIRDTYTVKSVIVEGSTHYTGDEIKTFVMTGPLSDNSLYLSYKYKNREVQGIPFVETIGVKIESPSSIRITVYEKALAGFVEYLGRYVYFDKDGIVVEVSSEKIQGIPEVVGVSYDYVVLHEKLPATDDAFFKKVLDVTKLLTKYGVSATKMYFKDSREIILYCGDITVELGKEDNLDIKLMNLKTILDKLEGKTGTLHMENFDEKSGKASFEQQ